MSKDPSRTEKATPKRINKAREEGNVPRSAELSKAMVLVASLVAMRMSIGMIGEEMSGLFTWFFHEGLRLELTDASVFRLFLMGTAKMAVMLLPTLLVIAVVAYATVRLQVGHIWNFKFDLKLERIFNLGAGLKSMFTIQTVMRLIKSLLQAAAVGWAAYAVLKAEWNNLLPLFYQTPEHIASYLLSSGYTMVWYSLVPLLVVGVADLVYTRWKYQEDLKMTKDEVKDERKQMDGSPEVKLAQRRKMAQMLKKRMMDQVPKADVILTNPTHLAVALRYDPLESAAPTVVAKGADFLAERIKEVARENRVPIRENKPLARALYKDVEVGEAIPEELYQAVATVLAEIYKVKGRKR